MLPAELTINLIVIRFFALLVIAAVNGVFVAGTAVLLGDKGPKHDGRLTPLPFVHLDLLGGVSHIVFGLGWTKPVAIDARCLHLGGLALVAVVLTPFVALLATAAVLQLLVAPVLTTLPYTAALATAAFLRVTASLCIWFALFNLIPIPPLTGGHLLSALKIEMPKQYEWIVGLAIVAAVAFGIVRPLIAPFYGVIAATPILGVR